MAYNGLKFTALEDNSSVSYVLRGSKSQPNIEKSTDGTNWVTWDGSSVSLNEGETLMLRGTNTQSFCVSDSFSNYVNICGTGKLKVYGNIMSLFDGGSCTQTEMPLGAFGELFRDNTALVDASGLILPADVVVKDAYIWMFRGCTNLVSAPQILATTCTNAKFHQGLYGMFYGCSSLEKSPVIHTTYVSNDTTLQMFYGCSKLNVIVSYIDESPQDILISWTEGVASTGTFYKLGSYNYPTGVNGIPTGWTVKTSLPLSVTPDSLTFDATGGTKTADVECENAWTASVDSVGDGYLKQNNEYTWWTTDYIPNSNTKVEVVYRRDNTITAAEVCNIFGSRNSSTSYGIMNVGVRKGSNEYIYCYNNGYSNIPDTTFEYGVKNTLTMESGKITINGVEFEIGTSFSDVATKPMYIGALSDNGSTSLHSWSKGFGGQIYSFKVWENGTLVRDYVPQSDLTFKDTVTGHVAALTGSAEYVSVTEAPDWLSTEVGSGELNVTASNNTGESRNATITLTDSEGNTATLTVEQSASGGEGKPTYLGSVTINKIFLGSVSIISAYLGNIKVFGQGEGGGGGGGGDTKYHFIPSTQNGNVGLLETVSNTFIQCPSDWTIESDDNGTYITNNGEATMVDLGYKPSVSDKTTFKYYYINPDGNQLLGNYVSYNDGVDTWRFFYYSNFAFDLGGDWCHRIETPNSNYLNKYMDVEIGNYYIKDNETGENIMSDTESTFDGVANHNIYLGTNGSATFRVYEITVK